MRNLCRTLVLMSLFLGTCLNAAGPVTHALLADLWMDLCGDYNAEEREAFMLGTLYPDIRYLAQTSREETHQKGTSLASVRAAVSPFQAGLLFHSYVDESRWKIVDDWGLQEVLIDLPEEQWDMFLKLLEDELFFKAQSWAHVKRYLKKIHPEEVSESVPSDLVSEWHTQLKWCFSYSPSWLLSFLSASSMGFGPVPPDLVKVWSKAMGPYSKDVTIRAYVDDLLEYLVIDMTEFLDS